MGYVHVQQNDIHHSLLEALEGSIRVIAQGRSWAEEEEVRGVVLFLVGTFGGRINDYQYWKCGPVTFRIQLPPALGMQQVLEIGNAWGEYTGW